jgi:hypothetical protein
MRSARRLAKDESPEREERSRCLRKPSNAGYRIVTPIFATVAKLVDAIQAAISVMLLQLKIKIESSRIRSNSRIRSRIRWLA